MEEPGKSPAFYLQYVYPIAFGVAHGVSVAHNVPAVPFAVYGYARTLRCGCEKG